MFLRILEVNWDAARMPLLPLTVMCFGLPLASVQGFGAETAASNLRALDGWLPMYPFLAFIVGVALALSVWHWDHEANHIYSLALPVSRAGWVVEKMTAGIVLMLIPTTAFTIGAHLATGMLTLPVGLNAYATDLSFRFFYATLVAYSVLFAMAAGSVRTTVLILTGLLGVFVVGQMVLSTVAALFGLPQVLLIDEFVSALSQWPGPFHVFLGDWMLVDV